MGKRTCLLMITGFFGVLAAANAQTAPTATAPAATAPAATAPAVTAPAAPPAPGTTNAFDGKYRLVSSTPTSKMYTAYNGQMGMCPNRKPGPLHIVGGRVHYMTATGYRLGGMAGSQGELTLRSEMLTSSRPTRLQASGTVDANGTVRVQQKGPSCNYDFVWQKRS
jgi:hypothetical protein